MRVIQIPTLFDNYTYLILCEKTGESAIVDSPDAEATIEVIKREGVNPVSIFSTHHHLDHVGGNIDLVQWKKMRVYGGKSDEGRIPKLTDPLCEGDTVTLGELKFKIIDIPGHTRGHIAFVTEEAVFCGDTLFLAGCGRLFEGTPEQMISSLTKLKNLPDNTKVYCGHEYSQKNLEFAQLLEPKNQALQKKYEEVLEKRKINQSTVPSTMEEERSYNPFFRWDSPELIENVCQKKPGLKKDPISIFAATRELKDKF